MSLRGHPLAFLFLEATQVPEARRFCEHRLGLPVLENRFHPPHHKHGIVKYDAGPLILALNKAPDTFDAQTHEDLVTVLRPVGRRDAVAELRGPDGHRFDLPEHAHPDAVHAVEELRLECDDLDASAEFFAERLNLGPAEREEGAARFAVGDVALSLRRRAGPAPTRIRRDGFLIVFHCDDVRRTVRALRDRGVVLDGEVVYSEIGGSVRFRDPSGNRFCLYEPSDEALAWESGPKVREIARSARAA